MNDLNEAFKEQLEKCGEYPCVRMYYAVDLYDTQRADKQLCYEELRYFSMLRHDGKYEVTKYWNDVLFKNLKYVGKVGYTNIPFFTRIDRSIPLQDDPMWMSPEKLEKLNDPANWKPLVDTED